MCRKKALFVSKNTNGHTLTRSERENAHIPKWQTPALEVHGCFKNMYTVKSPVANRRPTKTLNQNQSK